MKIALTGAAGGLGVHTARALVEAGHTVRGTDQVTRPDLPIHVEVANLLDRESCYKLFDGVDAVVHLANHANEYLRDKQRLLNENLTMNTNVFQACRELGINKIVFASSIQALGGSKKVGDDNISTLEYLPIDGNVPAKPTNVYGLSKQLSEEMLRYYAREAGISCTAIRFPYLPHRKPRSFEHWRDVSTHKINEAWGYLPVWEGASLIVAILNADLPGFRIYCPAAKRNRHGLPAAEVINNNFGNISLKRPLKEIESLFDISRITEETGWAPQEDWTFDE